MHKDFRKNYFQDKAQVKTLDTGAGNGDGKGKQSLREPVVRVVLLGSS